ncbi:MAG: hypothetical protein R3E88_12740 [Myxococcota bacterium]
MRAVQQVVSLLATAVMLSCVSNLRSPEQFAGTWGWTELGPSCAENPHSITFSADHEFMELQMRDPTTARWGETVQTVRYRVLGWTREGHLRTQIIGEKETAPDGSLLVWDLVRLSPDRYCWHRADWALDECTAPMERCRPGLPTDGGAPSRR